ncbi:MAG: hypothetical protein HZA13_01905 [Nitrospirae bacterium]|nr:hypothetical protein [Nitrospirota bacterium]
MQKIATLKIARFNSPLLLKETTGSKVAGVTGVLFGAIGGGIGGGIQYKMEEGNGRELQERFKLPDYGELVMNNFLKRAPIEVSNWPQMIPENSPVKDDSNISGHRLLIKVDMIKVKDGAGFLAETTASLQDAEKNILWQKKFRYESKNHSRVSDLGKLEEENGGLLREEYEFAAEKTTSNLIEDLNGSGK